MSAWAKPGVKCVCIRLDWINPDYDGLTPVVGDTYTVREANADFMGNLCVSLVEIPQVHPGMGSFGPHWLVDQFRPLVTKTEEEDIAIFQPLLETKRVEETV